MVFNNPKNAPASLLKMPSPANWDTVVKNLAKKDKPTITAIKVTAKAKILIVLGDQEKCELISDCAKDENLMAMKIPTSSEKKEETSIKKPFQNPRTIP